MHSGAEAVPFWINELARAARQSKLGRQVLVAERLFRRVFRPELLSPTIVPVFVTPAPEPSTDTAPEPNASRVEQTTAPGTTDATPKLRRAAFTRQVFEFEGER